MKVLIVEDDSNIRELLATYFEAGGNEVTTAIDGVSALEQFRSGIHDLVLLDIILPRRDGWSVLAELRKSSDVPVIFLTSLHGTEDVVRGLALGADDYLRKPFEIRELEARIDALRRRTRSAWGHGVVSAGPIAIDRRTRRVTVHGREVSLTPKELLLLELFASDPGRVFSHEEILARLWTDSPRATAADVKQYVHLLRKKLGREKGEDPLVVTVKGFGYKLVV